MSGSWQAQPGASSFDLPAISPNGAGQSPQGAPAPGSQPITAQRAAWAQGGASQQSGMAGPIWPMEQGQNLPPLDPSAQSSVAPRFDPFSRSSTINQQTAATQSAGRDFVVASRDMTNSGRLILPAAKQAAYVLVVDDSPSVRRVVSGMLKANGWDPRSARDGVEALEMIGKERPAAVLLDIEMPRMDGYELMATLRSDAQYRTLPLIVLTSRAASKHQQRATQLGADAYIIKPYQDDFLLNTLATLVQRELGGGH